MRRPWVEGEVEASRPGIDTPRHSRRGGVHEVLSSVDPGSAWLLRLRRLCSSIHLICLPEQGSFKAR